MFDSIFELSTVDVLLQSSALETLQTVRLASEAVTLALGLAISYVAYRGYRRNQSRPMLFVAAGFALIVLVPALVVGVLFVGADVPLPVVNSIAQASELLGMGSILYGLWTPRQ
jgi:hypothetical protein